MTQNFLRRQKKDVPISFDDIAAKKFFYESFDIWINRRCSADPSMHSSTEPAPCLFQRPVPYRKAFNCSFVELFPFRLCCSAQHEVLRPAVFHLVLHFFVYSVHHARDGSEDCWSNCLDFLQQGFDVSSTKVPRAAGNHHRAVHATLEYVRHWKVAEPDVVFCPRLVDREDCDAARHRANVLVSQNDAFWISSCS